MNETDQTSASTQQLRREEKRPNLIEVRRVVKEPEHQPKRPGAALLLRWSNGCDVEIPSTALRKACPCASCLEKRGDSTHSRPLSSSPDAPSPGAPSPETRRSSLLRVVQSDFSSETDLAELWPIGNYAIGMRWGDRHDTGIYSYEHLWQLSQSVLATREQSA